MSIATVFSALRDPKGYLKEQCIVGVIEAVAGPSLARYAPLMAIMFRMVQAPKAGVAWMDHVDKHVGQLVAAAGKPINEFMDEAFIKNFETLTGQPGDFLRSRDGILQVMHNAPRFQGLTEQAFSKMASEIGDHSVTFAPRFPGVGPITFPEWILKHGTPGIRLVGDVNRQPAINLRNLRVLGFALVDDKATAAGKYVPTPNPLEQINSRPKGVDAAGNAYEYRYYGPNNPLPNGDAINELDRIGQAHDYAYAKYGYNTPGAREADRAMVLAIQAAIASGAIAKDSKYNEYSLAKAGLLYFSTVDVK